MATTSTYQFQSGPLDYQKTPPTEPNPVTTPYDPNFISNLQFTPSPYQQGMGPLSAGMKTAGQLTQSVQQSAMQQLGRVTQYIDYLQRLRNLARSAAASVARKGAGQQQNPLAVQQALGDLANQASMPIDAEIQKAIINSNNVENTLNSFILQAGELYARLGQVASSGRTNISLGGRNTQGGGGAGGQSGEYQDIQGNIYRVDPGGRRTLIKAGDNYMATHGPKPQAQFDVAQQGTQEGSPFDLRIGGNQEDMFAGIPGLSNWMNQGTDMNTWQNSFGPSQAPTTMAGVGDEMGAPVNAGMSFAPSRANEFDVNPDQFMANNTYQSEDTGMAENYTPNFGTLNLASNF